MKITKKLQNIYELKKIEKLSKKHKLPTKEVEKKIKEVKNVMD